MIALPEPRGAVTDLLLRALPAGIQRLPATEPTDAEDLQLALYLCYELHYRGLPGVDDRWEWEPSLLALRGALEERFEAELRRDVPLPQPRAAIDLELRAIEQADDAPSLSRHLERAGTLDQYLEFVVHRSAYQLKEADPHSWALPRLHGGPKAAMVEIQADEYGGGRLGRMHAEMFARTMEGAGLDPEFGRYADLVPAITLASVNMMSLFGLQRRLRGAIAGHLAIYEMTSSIPNAKYARGFRRLGFDSPVTDYFDEHVEADAVHEQIAGRDLAGALAEDRPDLLPDIMFGAAACVTVDGWVGAHILDAWSNGESSLRAEVRG